MNVSPWLSILLIAACPALTGCSDDAPQTPVADAGVIDSGGGAMDVPAVDQGPALIDSGCPAPQPVTPASVPSGFLAPASMFYVRTVDGDTAHFRYMGVESTVRFLWVNTEEAHARPASKNTAFGIQTADTVTGYLGAGRAFTVVRQASATMPTMPAVDDFRRTLALIFVDGELFQLRLVREGLSAYYTDFGCAPEPIHTALLFAEAEARANRRGIWAPGHPTNYAEVLARWIGTGSRACRPNPFRNQSYCP